MASCIQVLTYRTGCTIHQQWVPRNSELLKFLRCKTYVGAASIRSNVHCANFKVQEKIENPTIPLVSDIHTTTKLQLNKIYYMPLTKLNEKSSSYVMIQKSNNSLVDKQRLGDIKYLIKSNQADHQAQNQDPDPSNKPRPEQVEGVAAVLKKDLPNLFSTPQNYHVYHTNLVFEDHIRGTRSTTLADYAKQMALLKIVGHLKYAFVELQVIKLTTHHSEGTIKVRWRIKGLSGFKVFINFWKYKVWNLKDSAMKDVEAWYDGFSIFYIKGDGLIHKHVLLKMQPDEDYQVELIKTDMTAKVA